MSQSLKEALAADPALADEFKAAITKAVVDFATSKGLALTENTELSPDDLEKVAGGGSAEFLTRMKDVMRAQSDIIKSIYGILD